jgi:nicotinate-nucleotide pyrophosphorylase (carboxylating)
MAMIKDNHREALARGELSLGEGVARIRELAPGIAVEVEIDDVDDIEAALAGKPEWILLDNMTPDDVRRAVALNGGRAKIEVSGGVTLATIRALAEAGPNAISVGALTHSAGALDIGLDLAF